MTRPTYVTPADRQREADIATRLSTSWAGVEFVPMPALSPIDWLAHRAGKIVAVVEVKARTHEPTTYPTLMLSARKWLVLREVARSFGVPAYIIVRFGDGSIRYGDIDELGIDCVRIAGRYDRGDPGDVEPCVFISVADMSEAIA